MLKEVLVVEGKMDTVAIGKALEADTMKPAALPWHPILCARLRLRIKNAG